MRGTAIARGHARFEFRVYGAGAGATSNNPSAFIAASKRPAGSKVLFHSKTFGSHASATV
jgi:hypothetical protein